MSIAIMSQLFKAQLGSTNRKMLAVRLADFADDEGRGIWPSVGRLARETEMSERSVQRILADFVTEGLLIIRKKGGSGKGDSTRYDLDLQAVQRLKSVGEAPAEGCHGDTLDGAEGCQADTLSDEEGVTPATPKGDTDDSLGRHGDTQTVKEPPKEPLEREGAREEGEISQKDDPKQFFDRVRLMELGGKGSVKWFGAESGSTTWAVQQFAKLTDEERRLAEERRDAFLNCCPKDKDGNPKPCSLGIYFRDKKFLTVAPGAVAASPTGGKIAVPPFGPVWAGMRALALLNGPQPPELPENIHDMVRQTFEAFRRSSVRGAMAYLRGKGIDLDSDGALIFPPDFLEAERRRRVVDEGYPEANRLHRLAQERESDRADGRFAALGQLCEPVPVDSGLFEKWRVYHVQAGWPFVPDSGAMRVVYFPKGGPDALPAFEQAARAALKGSGQ